jgi:hypothetical protein
MVCWWENDQKNLYANQKATNENVMMIRKQLKTVVSWSEVMKEKIYDF